MSSVIRKFNLGVKLVYLIKFKIKTCDSEIDEEVNARYKNQAKYFFIVRKTTQAESKSWREGVNHQIYM